MPTLVTEAAAGAVTMLAVASVLDGASDDDRILAYCLCGSFFGSLAHILRFKIYEHDGVVAAFLGNAIIAALLSPSLCEWSCGGLQIPVKFSSCLFVSGIIGLLGGWIGKEVFPLIGEKLKGVAKSLNVIAMLARMWGYKPDLPREHKPRRKTHDDGR